MSVEFRNYCYSLAVKIALHKFSKSGFTYHKLIDGRIFAAVGLEFDMKGIHRHKLFDEDFLMVPVVKCWH